MEEVESQAEKVDLGCYRDNHCNDTLDSHTLQFLYLLVKQHPLMGGSCCAGTVHQEAGIASSILQRRKLRLREGNFLFKLQ